MAFLINKITSQGLISGDTSLRVYDSTGKLKTIGGGGGGGGTVTSVSGTGSVSGITLSGTVTTSGSLVLGGTLTLTASDITTGLGYTPYDASNPANYIALTDLSAGTGISYNNLTGVITNSAPDQTVVLTQGGTTTITGTYPSFTISSADQYTGTVTSVGLVVPTPTNPAFSVSGSPVTGAGNLTITANGSSSQYIDGTGALQTFPTSGDLLAGNATQVSSGVYTTTITGVASYAAGDSYMIKFDSINDGASTLNINGLGAKDIFKNTIVPLSEGDIKANQEIMVVYDGTNFQAIGLVSTQLLAHVHNAEGATITKGQVVYAYQASGNKMSVKLAKADADATSAKTIGFVYDASIASGAEGYIIIQGVIEGVNTSAFSAGDTLYLSGTTAGAVTATKQYAPIHLVYVGIVERANAGNGQIYVRCQNGYELDELHDVQAQSPADKDTLWYDNSVTPKQWKTASIPTILGYTPVTNARTISTTSPLSGGGDLSANRTLSIADAAADGSTKGAAAFTAADFNATSGVISLDYTNGQKASASQPGFLSAADWSTFNGKAAQDTFVMRFGLTGQNPADSQNYYLNDGPGSLNTTSTVYRTIFPYACTLIGVSIQVHTTSGNASSETSTFNFRLNNTTDTLLSSAVTFGGAAVMCNVYSVTGLSVAIAAGDTAAIKWTTPAWVTNPTGTGVFIQCYFQRT